MSKRILFLAVLLSSQLIAGSAVAQQCTGTSADNLLACAHISLESCREDLACSADRGQAVSVQDLVESVADRCCSLTGNRQRKCLVRASAELNRSRRNSSRLIRPFLTQARIAVSELRTNNCSTGSLGQL